MLQRTSAQCYCGVKATHWLPDDSERIISRCDDHWTVFQAIASDLIKLVEADGGRVLGFGFVGVDIGYTHNRFAFGDWVTDGKHKTPLWRLQHNAIAGRWVPE